MSIFSLQWLSKSESCFPDRFSSSNIARYKLTHTHTHTDSCQCSAATLIRIVCAWFLTNAFWIRNIKKKIIRWNFLMRNILEQHNLCMERVCTPNQTGLQTQRTKNHTNAMQEHRFNTMFTNPSFAGCLADELCIALTLDWIERVRSHRQTDFNIEITCSLNFNSHIYVHSQATV